MKQKPLLMRGGLSGAVFVVTRYKRHDDGLVEALEKFDVTDQFEALCEQAKS